MTRTPFAREGWITFGNPNHYSGDGLLLRELRARARDTDPDARGAPSALSDLEQSFFAENGQKLTEANASIFGCGISDEVADYLSDMAPEGYVFELRSNAGNSNYGYFRDGDWITSQEFYGRIYKEYGDAGGDAAASMCLTDADYALGYDHCLTAVLPALEEELLTAKDGDEE